MSIWQVKALKSAVHYEDSQFLSSICSIFTLPEDSRSTMRIKTTADAGPRRGYKNQVADLSGANLHCSRDRHGLNLKCDCYARERLTLIGHIAERLRVTLARHAPAFATPLLPSL
jgi:hypothetical protein